MGGWSRNQKMNLGLIALLAFRRARAEQARRVAKDGATKGGAVAPVTPPKMRRGWFR
ncbi:hypothetical protein KOAAANKH_03038 [Brevundimonas sp. NIBR10]|nr:hypothetical protein KOAAANKH_03038 [Brevundimonas sp. NIBR10]